MVIAVETYLHRKGWWVLVPVKVGQHELHMVLDSGSPASSISQPTRDTLAAIDLVETVRRDVYALRSATIAGQPVRDLRVRISRRVTNLGIDGLLGLDFLGRFTDVHFHVPSMRLTLSDELS